MHGVSHLRYVPEMIAAVQADIRDSRCTGGHM